MINYGNYTEILAELQRQIDKGQDSGGWKVW